MANIQTQDQATIVSNQVAAMQSQSKKPLDFTVGAVLLALVQAVAAITLWLQGMILQLLTLTRAATSVGPDLDSWYADFNFFRLIGTAATGNVIFSRFSNVGQALVPAGTIVQTADGSQPFTVTIDLTNGAWSVPLNAYVMGNSVTSVTVPVQAQNIGTGGNVLADTITSIAQSLPGVDTVANASAFTNGIATESDPAFQARFPLYLASLSKGSNPAVKGAIASVQQGLNYTITEEFDYNGAADDGFFYVVVDDGTGSPSTQLKTNVQIAIGNTRACGIRYAVFGPLVTTVNVSMNIHVSSAFNQSIVVGQVGTALANFLNAMVLQQSLPYTAVAGVAYGVAGVLNVTSVLVNSGTSDITIDAQHLIKAGTVTVNPF